MGIRARPNSGDEAEDDTIPATISRLKTAFLPSEYSRAERALLGRESKLKREIEKLRNENAKLVEMVGCKDVIGEQKRRIRELERQNLKLEGLVQSEYEGWKGLISKLEVDANKLREEKGFLKLSSEDAGLIDRHNECAPKETEMLCEISEMHKDTESLGVTGVETNPRVPKRKPSSSLSGSDDEKGGGKMKEDRNSNSEMKQRQKLRVEPEILDFSASNVSENQTLPNHEQVNPRESEVKIMAEQKSQLFIDAPMEVSSDSDNDPSANLSSSSSSSSTDSEDDYLLLSQLDQIIPEAKTRELLYNLYQPDPSEELSELKRQVAALIGACERLEVEKSRLEREKVRLEERAKKQVAKLEGQVRSLEEENERAEEERSELEARVDELQVGVATVRAAAAAAAAAGEEDPELFQRVIQKYHDSDQFLELLEKARESGIADAYVEWEEKGYLDTSRMPKAGADDDVDGQLAEEEQPGGEGGFRPSEPVREDGVTPSEEAGGQVGPAEEGDAAAP